MSERSRFHHLQRNVSTYVIQIGVVTSWYIALLIRFAGRGLNVTLASLMWIATMMFTCINGLEGKQFCSLLAHVLFPTFETTYLTRIW